MVQYEQKKIAELDTGYVKEHHLQQQLKDKRRRGLFRRLAVFFVIFACLCGLLISHLHSQQTAIDQKEREELQLKKKVATLKKQQSQLKQDVHNLNNIDYIKDLARKKFFMTSKDETVFIDENSSSH
ncbi:Cell-division initiation protein [Fictibacillus macauensis ZFHKF-1]|uniref:Cell-division initiation protein n=1 Tax=Fictibacillus macauensis ZFHKF-1 TaxID=1196324 RepID=I8AFM9_9BACL|nr:septum formation initiator family protein [Fictibacillus macauensis]EIT84174.1 Cell-division initiation protein [Fictibacillus macauensis ZFHKF-1]